MRFLSSLYTLANKEESTKTKEGTEFVDEKVVFIGGDVKVVTENVLVKTIKVDFNNSKENQLEDRGFAEEDSSSNEDSNSGVTGIDEVSNIELKVGVPVISENTVPEFVNNKRPLEDSSSKEESVEKSTNRTVATKSKEVTVTDQSKDNDVAVVKVSQGADISNTGREISTSISKFSRGSSKRRSDRGVSSNGTVEDQKGNLEEQKEEEEVVASFSINASHFL